ncbi:hypothetical protein BDV98DRAFT_124408 [Pterulicium gracile]|uniref:F-box domain-containing protein n=1 Tax=Pterulicium gracile TaxID=1884261 RepID=A0A5C3QCV2_9AGAR|nr:hypothetical protein BDV98DRAFT_124408 [Pterula gracilis]
MEGLNVGWNRIDSHLAAFEWRLSIFLTRSQSHPLRIRLDLRLKGDGYRKFLTALLSPQSHRWDSVWLSDSRGPPSVWMDGKERLKPMPHLKTLSLRGRLFESIERILVDLDAIGEIYALLTQCPSVTTLSLDSFPTSESAAAKSLRQGIPWENIRKLGLKIHRRSLAGSTHLHLPDILSRLQNLTHMHLHHPGTNGTMSGPIGPFVFPELIGLVMKAPNTDWMMAEFVAPRLVSLELTGGGGFRPSTLAAFITRSRCRIQYLQLLELREDNNPKDFAAQVLPHLHDLRLLSVSDGLLGACLKILRYLRGQDESSGPTGLPCPGLEASNFCSSVLRDRSAEDETFRKLLLEELAGFVEARWATPKSVSMDSDRAQRRSPNTDRQTLQFRVYTGSAHIDLPNVDSVMDRIMKVAVVDEMTRVDVDVGFRSQTLEALSALRRDMQYIWFKPQLPPGLVQGVSGF